MRLTFYMRRGFLFLFCLNLVLLYFFVVLSYQDIQDSTLRGLQNALTISVFLYLLLSCLFVVEAAVEAILFWRRPRRPAAPAPLAPPGDGTRRREAPPPRNRGFVLFVLISLVFMIPFYVILLAAGSLVQI